MKSFAAALKSVPSWLWIFLVCFVFYFCAKSFGKN